jgi:peptidyl-prolyl cis-trans isomerase D
MVKPFEDAAFNNKVNEITIVTTQFGIHLVQTTARGKETRQVQVVYLVRNVSPSTQTYQNVYAQASEFAGKNFTKKVSMKQLQEQNLNKRTASVREADRQIAGLENSRQVIRAAYDTKVGNLVADQQGSTIFDLGENFVIATLVSASEEGVSDYETVKERVKLAVLNEKKSQFLVEKAKNALNGKSDLEAVASELGVTVRNADNINFSSIQIPGAGMEPRVIGTATNLSPNELSQPVAGNNGVFVVEVTSVNEGNVNLENERMRMAQNINFRAASQAYNVHMDKAEIEDQRAKFY